MSAQYGVRGFAHPQTAPAHPSNVRRSAYPRTHTAQSRRKAMLTALGTLGAPVLVVAILAAVGLAKGNEGAGVGSFSGTQGLRGTTVPAFSAPTPVTSAPAHDRPAQRPDQAAAAPSPRPDHSTGGPTAAPKAPTHTAPTHTAPRPTGQGVHKTHPAPAPVVQPAPTGPGSPSPYPSGGAAEPGSTSGTSGTTSGSGGSGSDHSDGG